MAGFVVIYIVTYRGDSFYPSPPPPPPPPLPHICVCVSVSLYVSLSLSFSLSRSLAALSALVFAIGNGFVKKLTFLNFTRV